MHKECTFNWFGQTWTCRREDRPDDESFGGEFDPASKSVNINSAYDDETFLNYIHHELMEGAIFLNACCFTRFYPDRKDMFLMDHSQMDIISGAVRGAYDMIKKNMGIGITPTPRKKRTSAKTKQKSASSRRKSSS